MGLTAMVERVPRSEQKQRLNEYVDTLDQTIQQIRATIFQLNEERPTAAGPGRRPGRRGQ